ncbi:MAG: ferrochelatase [Acidobacteria bacterium]|nr:ferrochelatase [Acidobacteriota bacterium]
MGDSPAEKLGVLLVNLGGPERPEDVAPFLYELFSDPQIIQLPGLLRKPLAALAAVVRRRTAAGIFRQIGGGSPLRRITEAQARHLEAALQHRGTSAQVFVGMRLWRPFLPEALEQIRSHGINRLVVLPLFPQFSVTTTGSCYRELNRWMRSDSPPVERLDIQSWYRHPGYLQALASLVAEEMNKFADPRPQEIHLLFSAHGLPEKYVRNGDPYQDQVQQTVELLRDHLPADVPWGLSYQSRVGPVRWLEPSTDEMIRQLASRGVQQLLVVPISFVSDHSETLFEIDILYRAKAHAAGIREFRRVPALNTHPLFIEALADLVELHCRGTAAVESYPWASPSLS